MNRTPQSDPSRLHGMQLSNLCLAFHLATDSPNSLQVTHQIRSEEVAWPLRLDLTHEVLAGDLDVRGVDSGQRSDFSGLLGEDRLEVGGADGLASVLR